MTKENNNFVFILMSFHPDMDPIYEAIKEVGEEFDLRIERVDEDPGDYKITDKIITSIEESLFIIADLTHERPNVYFELGYARGLDKFVIQASHKDSKLHFDIQDWNTSFYRDSRELQANLRKRIPRVLGQIANLPTHRKTNKSKRLATGINSLQILLSHVENHDRYVNYDLINDLGPQDLEFLFSNIVSNMKESVAYLPLSEYPQSTEKTTILIRFAEALMEKSDLPQKYNIAKNIVINNLPKGFYPDEIEDYLVDLTKTSNVLHLISTDSKSKHKLIQFFGESTSYRMTGTRCRFIDPLLSYFDVKELELIITYSMTNNQIHNAWEGEDLLKRLISVRKADLHSELIDQLSKYL